MDSDNALMELVQAGRTEHLATLFERYHKPLYSYFMRTGNQSAASEDLVQETFTRVLTYRMSFSGTANFRSWLFGIASNTRVDYYRRSKQDRPHCDVDELALSAQQNVSDDYEAKQRTEHFNLALNSLDPEQREIIVLSRFAQLNYEEIADMQKCNLNTLKSRMRKALNDLQQAYQTLAGEGS
jgi:RNA polymerase sigma-70 factor (ECF subfamily)